MAVSVPLQLERVLDVLRKAEMGAWTDQLEHELPPLFEPGRNGNLPRWLSALQQRPTQHAAVVERNRPVVKIGDLAELESEQREALEALMRQLHPWRKGPFNFFGIHSIDVLSSLNLEISFL